MKGDGKEEEEANSWAANFLVPQHELGKFITRGLFSKADIVSFGEDIGIAPGIVVGQLQNRRVIPWKSPLNKLKILFEWSSKSEKPHKN